MTKFKKHEATNKPLDETWWTQSPQRSFPSDDAPILVPYEKTSPGFELLVAETCKYWRDMDCFSLTEEGNFKVCLWNIWEQKKDPADFDQEKQKINQMQQALGELTDDDRYIRIQIACFARCFWTFPANVDLILDGIATGKVNLEAGISCEPPWSTMREVLHRRRGLAAGPQNPVIAWLHHQQDCDLLADPRQELLRAYSVILTWWCATGHPDCLKAKLPDRADLIETIYRYLGEPTKLKWLYVQKLCKSLDFWAIPRLPQDKYWPEPFELAKVYDSAIERELGGKEDMISKLIERNNDNGSCHHAFIRHIDHILAHIGAGRPVELPGAGEERKRIHETIVNYVHALGSWLAGRTPEQTVLIWPPCEETTHRLYDVLDKHTPRKRWLVACLWKKLQEDRVHGGRGALDEQPERFVLPASALF